MPLSDSQLNHRRKRKNFTRSFRESFYGYMIETWTYDRENYAKLEDDRPVQRRKKRGNRAFGRKGEIEI